MGYEAKVICDSLSPDGVRLTTMQVKYPHAIHKDIMTHRMFSRNFQSFRAFPPEKVIRDIEVDPFIPESFDTRVTGMGQGVPHPDQDAAHRVWMRHVGQALLTARYMLGLNLAKAQVNFVLQDLTWITGIITATEWDNFWALRADADNVRPEVGKIARMMKEAFNASEPEGLLIGEPHLPYIELQDRCDAVDYEQLKLVSSGRCARISYLTHDGRRDMDADIGLSNRLITDGHMSPFEHVAMPLALTGPKYVKEIYHGPSGPVEMTKLGPDWRGNLYGWHPMRKTLPNEHDYSQV